MKNGGLRIGQVAKRIGLDVRLIRHYERIGLIPPPGRTKAGYASAGYRLFTEEHVQRLEFIALARVLDLPLREIGELLGCIDEGCCDSAQPRLGGLLVKKLQEVDWRITMLQALRNQLQHYQRLSELTECQGTEECTPTTSPIQCAFGETPLNVNREKSAPGVTNLLTLQQLEGLKSNREARKERG